MTKHIELEDLEHILEHTSHLWDEMRGNSIFITGGTGFFGHWLLESFIYANDRFHLGAKAVVLSRKPGDFAAKAPHLACHPAVNLLEGDVLTFNFPDGVFPLIIHAATSSSSQLNRENPLLMLDTIVEGTRRTLEFARTHGTHKFLLTSSGAVYGKQPPTITNLQEDCTNAPDTMDPGSSYAEGKRLAEMLCRLYAGNTGMEIKIARCFAFVGPYLPLDAHYAIGNFIRDACPGGPIHVKGDGTPYRSYLYAADLAAWLWTILFKGRTCWPYNVGSDISISIADLASVVRQSTNPGMEITVAGRADPGCPPQRYVPSIDRARNDLGLDVWIPLQQAIDKTIHWLRQQDS